MRKFLIALILCLPLSTGCTGLVGHARPVMVSPESSEHAAAYGCEIKGVEWSFGQSSACQTEGGPISDAFSDMVDAVVDPAMRIISGVFNGLSAASSPD